MRFTIHVCDRCQTRFEESTDHRMLNCGPVGWSTLTLHRHVTPIDEEESSVGISRMGVQGMHNEVESAELCEECTDKVQDAMREAMRLPQ